MCHTNVLFELDSCPWYSALITLSLLWNLEQLLKNVLRLRQTVYSTSGSSSGSKCRIATWTSGRLWVDRIVPNLLFPEPKFGWACFHKPSLLNQRYLNWQVASAMQLTESLKVPYVDTGGYWNSPRRTWHCSLQSKDSPRPSHLALHQCGTAAAGHSGWMCQVKAVRPLNPNSPAHRASLCGHGLCPMWWMLRRVASELEEKECNSKGQGHTNFYFRGFVERLCQPVLLTAVLQFKGSNKHHN